MTDPLDIALVVLGMLLLLVGGALLARRRRPPDAFAPLPLLSPSEQAFLANLEEAAGPPFRVLAKVPLIRLVEPAAVLSRKQRRQAADRLQPHLLDFLLCRRDDLQVETVVSLGSDPSATEELQSILAVAGIPCLSIPVTPLPSVPQLRKRLTSHGGATASEDEDWQLGSLNWLGRTADEEEWQLGLSRPRSQAPEAKPAQVILCPECGAAMVRRKMARGPHAGREFWVCPGYPDCRRMLPVLSD